MSKKAPIFREERMSGNPVQELLGSKQSGERKDNTGKCTQMPFPEAVERRLNKKICMKCNARNAPTAKRCRKCGSPDLRMKAKERRGGQ